MSDIPFILLRRENIGIFGVAFSHNAILNLPRELKIGSLYSLNAI